jgi:hypothetical protein
LIYIFVFLLLRAVLTTQAIIFWLTGLFFIIEGRDYTSYNFLIDRFVFYYWGLWLHKLWFLDWQVCFLLLRAVTTQAIIFWLTGLFFSLRIMTTQAIIFWLTGLFFIIEDRDYTCYNFLIDRFVPYQVNEDDDYTSYENMAVYVISMYQYITLAIVFSKGRPYRKTIFTNCKSGRKLIIFSNGGRCLLNR